MQPHISDRPGVLKDEQILTLWKSPDMEGANPADILSVCLSTNTTQTTATSFTRYQKKVESFSTI